MNIITIYMPGNDWDLELLELALKQYPREIYVYFKDGSCEVIVSNKSC